MGETIVRDAAAQVQTQDTEMQLMAEARKRRISDLQRTRETQLNADSRARNARHCVGR
jgi:hypothetical protein